MVKNFENDSWEYVVSKHFLLAKQGTASTDNIIKRKWEEETLQKWCLVLDKLQRIDNLEREDIIKVIDFALKDDFWTKQFFTLDKLRKTNKEWVQYWAVWKDKLKPINNIIKKWWWARKAL